MEKPVQGIQSVEIAASLLKILARERKPMALGKLAEAAGMSASKARRYLVSLCRSQLVQQNPESGHYGVGALALALGNAASTRQQILPVAIPMMQALRNEVNETVSLHVWGPQGPLVLHYEESGHPVRLNTVVGSLMPMLTSASGQIFGAFMPPEQTAALLEDERRHLWEKGDRSLPDAESVGRLYTQIRKRGLSRSDGRVLPNVSALGAPIFHADGALAGALSEIGHRGSFDSRLEGPVAAALLRAAREISRRL